MIRWRDLNALDDLLAASVSARVGELDRALNGAAPRRGAAPSFPRLSLYEHEGGFELVAPLPGVAPESLDLKIERDALSIRGERKLEDLEGHTCLRRERRRGAFGREIRLPAPIASDRVEASLKDGVLRVLLPKAPEARPRKIEVKSS